jgi:hypothetical protein
VCVYTCVCVWGGGGELMYFVWLFILFDYTYVHQCLRWWNVTMFTMFLIMFLSAYLKWRSALQNGIFLYRDFCESCLIELIVEGFCRWKLSSVNVNTILDYRPSGIIPSENLFYTHSCWVTRWLRGFSCRKSFSEQKIWFPWDFTQTTISIFNILTKIKSS